MEQVFGINDFRNYQQQIFPVLTGAQLGAVFNSSKGAITIPQILEAFPPAEVPADVVTGLGAGSFLRGSSLETKDLYERTNSLNASASAKAGLFSATARLNIDSKFRSNTYRKLYAYECMATSAARMLDTANFTSLVSDGYKQQLQDLDAFRARYGDYVIVGYVLGSGGSMFLSYETRDTTEEQTIAASLDARKGQYQAAVSWKETIQRLQSEARLEISTVTFGGCSVGDLYKEWHDLENTVKGLADKIDQPDANWHRLTDRQIGTVVQWILAPISSLVGGRTPGSPDLSIAFDRATRLLDRIGELQDLQRSFESTKTDPYNYMNRTLGLRNHRDLARAIDLSKSSLYEILADLAPPRDTAQANLSAKYGNSVVSQVPVFSWWKTSEQNRDLLSYVCANSIANQPGALINFPSGIDRNKPIKIGLYGDFLTKGVPQPNVMQQNGMLGSDPSYRIVFTIGPTLVEKHGQLYEFADSQNLEVRIQLSKILSNDCKDYTSLSTNPFRLLFVQEDDVNIDPWEVKPRSQAV